MLKVKYDEDEIMLRVLHFIPGFNIGGVESLIMSLYRHIDKSKIQFDFLVETQEWLQEFTSIENLGGKVIQINALKKSKPIAYILQIQRFFKQYGRNYQVFHCHNMERGVVALYYAKKYQIKNRIFHAHTDSFTGVNYESLVKLLVRIDNKLSTHYLACSIAAGEFQFKNSNKTFTVLKNAIDTDLFRFSPAKQKAIREELKLEMAFVIGHTGRFTYAKNHKRIIAIFNQVYQKLPRAHLLLIGDGPIRPLIEEEVENLGLTDAVTIMGSQNDIAKYLHCMDVFLLPSFFEGFCISLLEAQSIGLPCIVSDIIPKEVKVTKLIKEHGLNEPNKNWANSIINLQNYIRKNHHNDIIRRGYDASDNSKWLIEYYFNIVKESLD